MTAKVTFDSQVFTYLVEANSGGYDPMADPDSDLARERVAAFRVFLYHPIIAMVPTVTREVHGIPDSAWRNEHELFRKVHFVDIPLDPAKVDALASYYRSLHRDMDDCRVVAEAELWRMDFLLTFDDDLMKHLSHRTGYVVLATPSWFWHFMKVLPGTPPTWTPHPTHPLYQATWWRWETAG